MNGVINIITKDARYTQGNYFTSRLGIKGKDISFRRGGKRTDNLFYKVFAKKKEENNSRIIDQNRGKIGDPAGDKWGLFTTGFRIDYEPTLKDNITVKSSLNKGIRNQDILINTTPTIDDKETIRGHTFDLNWKHFLGDTNFLNLHSYYDSSSRKSLLGNIYKDVFNIDFDFKFNFNSRNNTKVGFGYRKIRDEILDSKINGIYVSTYSPVFEEKELLSAFILNSFSVIKDKFSIKAGGRYNKHYYTGDSFTPEYRILFTPNDKNSFWASYSRSIREPSRMERSLTKLFKSYDNYQLYWTYNKFFKEEKLSSREIGYRTILFDRTELDISLYLNHHKQVRTFENTDNPFIFQVDNKLSSKNRGVNASLSYFFSDKINFFIGYSYIDIDFKFDNDSTDFVTKFDAGVSPRNQASLQVRTNPSQNTKLDAYLYYVDNLKSVNINDYIRFDLRLAWKPTKHSEISIVGQKLFNNYYIEQTRSFFSTYNETGRDIYMRIKWQY